MHQILFQIPNTPIRLFSFGVMMVFALWGALGLASWRARRENLDPEMVADLAFWVILAGVVGARAFYVAEIWGTPEMDHWTDVFAIWKGGIVLYGSMIGAAVGFLAYRALRSFPVLPTLDVIAPSIALGIAFGRVGCFLNGCCYGDRCGLPWAVKFPKGTIPWADHVRHGWITKVAERSLPVHPAQLYSALDAVIILALLTAYYPLRKRDGEVMALLMIAYGTTRFLIEALRDDDGVFALAMTVSQAISVVLVAGGLAFWAGLRRWGPTRLHVEEAAEIAAAA